MHLRAQNFVLGLAALVCFVDAFVAKGDDPGPAITAVLGILLVRRALVISPQSPLVIIAGCGLTALVIAGNHSVVNISNTFVQYPSLCGDIACSFHLVTLTPTMMSHSVSDTSAIPAGSMM